MAEQGEASRFEQALVELCMCIHSRRSSDEIMQLTLDGFVATLGADAGDIKLLADDAWEVRYEHGFGREVVGLRLNAREVPLAERVRRLRTAVVVEDYLAEPPDLYVGLTAEHRLGAALAVPIEIRDQFVGVLFAWMRSAPRRFTEAEIDFGRQVAASVSLALENAELLSAEKSARVRAEATEDRLQAELKRTHALLRASDELFGISDPNVLLERLADVLLEATGLTRVQINLVNLRERVLVPKVAAGRLAEPRRRNVPFEELSETVRNAIALGRPTVLDLEQPETDGPAVDATAAADARLVLFVPLMHQGVIRGFVSLDEPGDRYDYTVEEIHLVASIAAQAAVALQGLQKTEEHAVEVLEQQLRSMAYGLHDGPVQTLSAAAAMLEQATSRDDLEETRAQTAAAGGLLDYATFEMREIMRELRPAELEETSLAAKIGRYAQALEARGGPPITVVVEGDEAPVTGAVQVCVFRVVQEALSNARKHSHAHAIEVCIRFTPAYVECVVSDDGDGFEPSRLMEADPSLHWGLAGMRERMLMISGDLNIVSTLGEGTEVRLRAPLGIDGGRPDGARH